MSAKHFFKKKKKDTDDKKENPAIEAMESYQKPIKVKKGLLHKKMGIDQDKKISGDKLSKEKAHAKKTGNTKLEKEVVFAENAKKWHHGK